MVILRTAAVADCSCSIRVKSTGVLCFPVQFLACISHFIINISCTRDTFGNVCSVGGNLRSNDTLFYIVYIWQCQMLGRCYVAKESSTVHGSNCASNGSSNMVISRSNICDEWSKCVEWSAHTDALLNFHIGCDLVKRYMSRTFDHDLYIMCPCTFCQFAEAYKLFNLAYVCGIGQTSRAACITKGDGNIVFFTDIQNFVEMFIERIFFSGHAHPCKYKTSSAAYDIHFTFVFFDLFNSFAGDSTVQCYKVHTVLSVKTYYIDEILCSQSSKISLIVDDAVIDRNSSDHCRTFVCQLLPERLSVAVAG